jgi:hypothetical protein
MSRRKARAGQGRSNQLRLAHRRTEQDLAHMFTDCHPVIAHLSVIFPATPGTPHRI